MSSDHDWDRCPYRDEIRAGMDPDNIDDEPVQHDVIVTPGGPLGGCYAVSMHDTPRGYLGTFVNWEEARAAIIARQEADQFWGGLWWCSDHGNLWRIRLDDMTEIEPDHEDHPFIDESTPDEDLDKSGDDLACDVEGCT